MKRILTPLVQASSYPVRRREMLSLQKASNVFSILKLLPQKINLRKNISASRRDPPSMIFSESSGLSLGFARLKFRSQPPLFFVLPLKRRRGIKGRYGETSAYDYRDYYITTVTISKPNSPGSPDLKAIGRRIRQIRGFEMRQVELAKVLGITQAQLSKYERGQNALSIELLLKLKHFSGKSSDWILTGEV